MPSGVGKGDNNVDAEGTMDWFFLVLQEIESEVLEENYIFKDLY